MARLRHLLPALATATLVATGCGYNTIQTKDEAVNRAGAQIKTQLQRRADLIPNLVETVKGFAKQETTIFIRVAEARSRLNTAVQGGNLQEMAAANTALNGVAGNTPSFGDPATRCRATRVGGEGSRRNHRNPTDYAADRGAAHDTFRQPCRHGRFPPSRA